MAATQQYADPKPAPFEPGHRVRYIGVSFKVDAGLGGWHNIGTGAVGECIKIKPGRKGGGFLGYDEDTGEPDYAPTRDDVSIVRFPCGYEVHVDADSPWFEPASD